MLPTGTPAPEFSVLDHQGNTVRLSDLKGQRVVLWFYPKADTPGCTMEGKGFRDDYEKFKGNNTVVLGVSLDNQADNKAFAEKYSFPFPLLCDVDRQLSIAYHAVQGAGDNYASRISYIIDEQGIIQESIEKVDTQNHSKDLCSRL